MQNEAGHEHLTLIVKRPWEQVTFPYLLLLSAFVLRWTVGGQLLRETGGKIPKRHGLET